MIASEIELVGTLRQLGIHMLTCCTYKFSMYVCMYLCMYECMYVCA